MLRVLGVWAFAGIAGALGLGAPAAWAGAGDDAHVEVVHHAGVTAGAVSEAPVLCPSGERAIGGGVLTDSGESGMTLSADGPLAQSGLTAQTNSGDVPRYWYTAIINNGAPHDFTHYAICSASSDATVAAEPFTVPLFFDGGGGSPPPQRKSGTVACPSGTRAISGGFGTSDAIPDAGRATASEPVSALADSAGADTGQTAVGWYVYIESTQPTPVSMKAFAICSPTAKATAQTTSFDAGVPAERAAVCPGGTRATGGGFGATTNSYVFGDPVWISTAPAAGSGSPALAEGDVPRAWFGRVDGSAYAATYRVYALCDPATPPGPTGQRAAALKKCKKKHSKKARKRCKKRALKLPI